MSCGKLQVIKELDSFLVLFLLLTNYLHIQVFLILSLSCFSCWLASLDKAGTFDPKRPMLWGFLLPLAVMLCFNTALLVYFSQTICCANPNLKRYVTES